MSCLPQKAPGRPQGLRLIGHVGDHPDQVADIEGARLLGDIRAREMVAQEARQVVDLILSEDRAVVESQCGPVPDSGEEISVATDAPSIAFRRWYQQLMRES